MKLSNAIGPYDEMIFYESLWGMRNQSLKKLSGLFKRHNASLPSQVWNFTHEPNLFGQSNELLEKVTHELSDLSGFSICVHGMAQYPNSLQDAKYPIELFYYQGDIGLTESPCVSIVGARDCSEKGKRRARRLARMLVEQGYTIVSGLAKGIDTEAMEEAIECDGRVIGVIGTPITEYYPKENKELQDKVAKNHLLISQVPFYRYRTEPFKYRSRYFPQRNATMAALSLGTVIVEASDKSGSLTQARACMQQGRKLFILNSCFENDKIQWPSTYEKRGAIKVTGQGIDDILMHLPSVNSAASCE